MAYIEPTTRSDGFIVTSSVWNQDVVANTLALRALTEVEPAVIYEINPDSPIAITTTVWNTRQLTGVLRDPDGIITNQDFANYRFDIADGDYLVEIFEQAMPYDHAVPSSTRLRDVDNNVTLMGTLFTNHTQTSGFGNHVHQNTYHMTYGEFTLANGGDTTIELQYYIPSGGGSIGAVTGSGDTDNVAKNGVWESVIKLWKYG